VIKIAFWFYTYEPKELCIKSGVKIPLWEGALLEVSGLVKSTGKYLDVT